MMLPRFTSLAWDDLRQIIGYISADNPAAADAFLSKIMETSNLIARSPSIGRIRRDLNVDLRSFPVGNYLIFYRETAGEVQVVRVLHGARDLGELI